MTRHPLVTLALISLTLGYWPAPLLSTEPTGMNDSTMSPADLSREPLLKALAADWRNGAVVYQVLVDRFAPSPRLQEKKGLYGPPRRLRGWDELPRAGTFNAEAQVWSHEIDFWGGDLASLKARLPYVAELGVDALYLNPIFTSLTNHKYDASDYNQVDPAYGSRAELADLASDLHRRGLRLILDGVFNHMGRQSPFFKEALADPKSRWRDFFRLTRSKPGYVGWNDVANLPELNLENPAVRDYIYARPDSVMQSYVRNEGIDGWRLDVAFDLGFRILKEMTDAVHAAKADAVVIGEIWNYPEEWFPSVDGVMNMHGRSIVLSLLKGTIPGPGAAAMWDTLVRDAGLPNILKSWLVLDNHDTPRLANLVRSLWQQRMARLLQFTLPGAVCLYYGSEVGMRGGEDPEQRAPMRWDLVERGNPTLTFHRALLKMRKDEPALRYGDFRVLSSQGLFAFLRRTSKVRETVVVLANPTDRPVSEPIQLRDSKLQDCTDLVDRFSKRSFRVFAGMIDVTLGAHEWVVLKASTADYPKGYSRYDRIR